MLHRRGRSDGGVLVTNGAVICREGGWESSGWLSAGWLGIFFSFWFMIYDFRFHLLEPRGSTTVRIQDQKKERDKNIMLVVLDMPSPKCPKCPNARGTRPNASAAE
jgi:hypothetical protein